MIMSEVSYLHEIYAQGLGLVGIFHIYITKLANALLSDDIMLKTAPGVLLLQGAGLCPPHPRTRETVFRCEQIFSAKS